MRNLRKILILHSRNSIFSASNPRQGIHIEARAAKSRKCLRCSDADGLWLVWSMQFVVRGNESYRPGQRVSQE